MSVIITTGLHFQARYFTIGLDGHLTRIIEGVRLSKQAESLSRLAGYKEESLLFVDFL